MNQPSSTVDLQSATLRAIQEPVAEHLDEVLDELRRIIVSDFDMIEEVNEYLRHLRGKLFRPTLLLLAERVEGTPGNSGVTLGAIVELVHLATLVHDDAVDHSVLRRGLPTVNALWTHQVAVIMGDYLYSRSVSELARLGHLEAIKVLAGAANEMSVGEMRQLTSYDALEFSEEDYFQLISSKTASLMAAACEMGALSGAPSHRDSLSTFGGSLGMAFQIADDLLDYSGSEAITGKPTGQDLRERKVTLPLVGAMRNASEKEMNSIRSFFTLVDPSEGEIQEVVGIVERCGGLAYSREKAEEYGRSAMDALTSLPPSRSRDALAASVDYAIGRNR